MDEKGFENLNIVPLVDIMLVLLTIVLTTSTFIAGKALPVSIPKADGGIAQGRQKYILIEIGRNGYVCIDSKQVSTDELRSCLGQKGKDTPVLVRADKSIELQGFVDIFDLIKKEGFGSVSLQTEARLRNH